MRWKIILLLSLSGLITGFLTVFYVPVRFEAAIGMPLYMLCGWLIGRNVEKRHFLHGFITGVISSAIITAVRAIYATTFFANNPKEAELFAKMSRESGATMVQSMELMSPFAALFTGLILGLFALAGNMIVRLMGGERL
jgi:di/tricarboxylate transporter